MKGAWDSYRVNGRHQRADTFVTVASGSSWSSGHSAFLTDSAPPVHRASTKFLDFATFYSNMGVSMGRPTRLARGVLNQMSKMGEVAITHGSARHQSVPCEAPVMVDAGQFWCTGHGAAVSTEELTVTDVHSPFEVGTGVDLYFELGGLVAIEGRAVVTRAEADSVTLHFLDLDPEAVHALEDYVSGDLHSNTHIRHRALPI
jgi:hypothetical protein